MDELARRLGAVKVDAVQSTIYVLQCAHDKYYVGKTEKDAKERMAEHVAGEGSAWTKLHTPQSVVETVPDQPFHEDAKTLEYMRKYGVDNVRGGKYSLPVLSPTDLTEIERSIRHEENRCLKCGSAGHFVTVCPSLANNTPQNAPQNAPENPLRNPLFGGRPACCTRCGRNTHTAVTCYAKTHLNGRPL